jgi:hypothetical protein
VRYEYFLYVVGEEAIQGNPGNISQAFSTLEFPDEDGESDDSREGKVIAAEILELNLGV